MALLAAACGAGRRSSSSLRSSSSHIWVNLPCLVLFGGERHIGSDSSAAGDGGREQPAAAVAAAEHLAGGGTLPDLGWCSAGAAALDALHAASGLPWAAAIPATSVAIKALLLPVSLKQAKIVRTNMALWTESFEFDRQMRAKRDAAAAEAAAEAPAGAAAAEQSQQQRQQQQQQLQAAGTAAAAVQQLQQWQQRVNVYHHLRRKCGVPHPAWFLVNQMLQVPVFIYTAASVRSMAQAGWPGFASEGALWFPDLTQPAVVLSAAGAHLPMGLPGLLLPLGVTAVMLTSIRLGFKASGAAARHPSVAGTWVAPLLSCLPAALYALTIAGAYLKVQLPQAAVLHWAATSSFTLCLQLGLRRPAVRRLLGYAQPAPGQAGGDVDPAVAAQAAAVDSPDILVVMGAKHAALQRYGSALHCLHRAMELDPGNARAHYSAGQIYALQHDWQPSEDHYRRCAELTGDAAARAQALYCAGVACHQQRKYQAALDAYGQARDAGGAPGMQPMLALGRLRAHRELGQHDAAAAAAAAFLASGDAATCPPAVLAALRAGAAGEGGEGPGSAQGG